MSFAKSEGMIDFAYLRTQHEKVERKEILSKHPYKVWQGKNKEWYTYLPDETKRYGKRTIKRKNKDDLEDLIVRYWKKEHSQTMLTFVQAWIDRRYELGYIAQSTKDRYTKDAIRYFGDDTRSAELLTDFQVVEYVEETVARLHLDAKAFGNMKTLLRGGFNLAKRRGQTDINIEAALATADIPKNAFKHVVKDDEKEVYNEEETELMMEYLSNNTDSKNLCILFMFLTGCRVGEATTIKHSDITGNAVRICRTATRFLDEKGKYHYEVKESPKTEAGFRYVVIPDDYSWVTDELQRLNFGQEYIFVDKYGKPVSPNGINNRLKKICKALGMVPKSPHKIRKTYASILLDNSVDTETITKLMGHTNIVTTELYYHRSRKSLEKMGEIISNLPEFRVKNTPENRKNRKTEMA